MEKEIKLKKNYSKPAMKVQNLKQNVSLLCSSCNDDIVKVEFEK